MTIVLPIDYLYWNIFLDILLVLALYYLFVINRGIK